MIEQLDFLYPISLALDFLTLAAVILTPILGVVSLSRYGWRHARFTIAYLGYLCCAVLVASFTMHLFLDGGEIFMIAVLWLIPFTIAAGVALSMTVAVVSSHALWHLALATTMLGLAQVLADRQPGGIGGGLAVLMLVINGAYALLVLGVCARHHDQWWRWPREQWGR